MKANMTSEKGMPDGSTHEVQVYAPSLDEWLAHFGANRERLASDYNQHKVANNLASALKGAMKSIMEATTEKPASEKAKAQVAKLEAKGVFDLRDFVNPAPREAAGDPVVKLIKEKWATSDKKDAFIAKFKLEGVTSASTTDEVIAAYKMGGDAL